MEDKRMYLRLSKSNKGVYMFLPSGKSMLIANRTHLEELLYGSRDWVVFSLQKAKEQPKVWEKIEGV